MGICNLNLYLYGDRCETNLQRYNQMSKQGSLPIVFFYTHESKYINPFPLEPIHISNICYVLEQYLCD